MKKAYEKPEIEITIFDCGDIMTYSGETDSDETEGTGFERILNGLGDDEGIDKFGNEHDE